MERTTAEAHDRFIWAPTPPEIREDGPPLPRSPLLSPAATDFDGTFSPAEQPGNKWSRSDMKDGEKLLGSCLIPDFMGPLAG